MKGTRPRPRLIALEPRLLFDGAAAAAVDQETPDHQNDRGVDTTHHAAMNADQEVQEASRSQLQAKRHLVVLDSRLDPQQRQSIIDNTRDTAELVVVESGQDGIDAITSALAGMDDVASIEIFSHGADGQFLLGNSHVSVDTLPQLEQQLGQWRDALNADADLLLYGCRVGEGASGQQLIDGLADATGADVAASDDDTGEARFGGDWQLETTRGDIDQQTGTDLVGLASMEGLLPAAPTVSLGAASQEVPLGESFDFTVSFRNTSAEIGYAPFIHLYVPTTGKDGAGAEIDDGITVNSASYVGGNLPITTVTFDDNGQAEHPIAKDANGNAVIINAADYGYRAGDTLVVVEIPFSSFGPDQPAIEVTFTATLSDLADTSATDGSPELDITAIGGFELGHDPLDNPQDDPSVIGTNPSVITIMPTVVDVEQTLNMTEDETATGENYIHSLTTTIKPAGIDPEVQTINNVVVTQPVPTNVQVTSIDPGSGTLTSITLASGQVVTNPTIIQAMIDRDDVFITEYTVEYAELTGAESSTVEFYVPEQDAEGNPVINPDTGDDVTITFDAPTGSGEWDPIDDRDEPDGGGTIDFSGTGEPISFTAKSIALHKTATIVTDTGAPGLTPGDTLDYQLQMTLSDYFAFGSSSQEQGQFVVTDTLGNGQTVQGTPTMTVTFVDGDGNVQQDVTVDLIYTEITNSDGTTALEFDVAASMEAAFPGQPWLAGDDAFDQVHDGTPTSATINYTTVIAEEYATGVDHPAINEGDSVSNSAVVNADILIDENNTTGFDESDNSSTETTVPTGQVDITIPSGDAELSPGEDVTFTISYDLITGDHENFTLTVYLPLPLLDTSGINWTEGSGPNTWALNAANTHGGEIISVASGPGNSLVFTFADVSDATAPSTIAIDFTMTVGDQPFADQRSLDVLAQSSQTTTLDKNELISEDVVRVQSVAEPVVDITHGVVSASNGTVSGTDGNWAAPGSSGAPHAGPVTDPSVGDGGVSDIDAGDTLRLATILKNTGGGGAYDVATTIEIPSDLAFVGGSLDAANLILTRGDGTELIEGTDYEVNGNTITLLDADNQATLLAGRDGTDNDNNGLNVIVITYDVQVVAAVAASRTMGSTATLNNYASVEGGEDFTPNDLSDDATQQVAAPEVSIGYKDGSLTDDDSSESHTSGTNLVVGESMDYDIVVTLPEGTTQDLNVSDLIPPGMVLDTTFNGGLGYELIQTSAGSGALSADFAGTVSVGSVNADGSLSFTASSADADNDTGNNSFVIRLRLIADNVQGNQQGTTHTNDAELSYSDPDGDEVNGTTPLDRNVASTGDGVVTNIVEPTVTIEQELTVPADPGPGVDFGDEVEFTITLNNTSGTDAFDLTLNTLLPEHVDDLSIASVVDSAGNVTAADFIIEDGVLRLADGSNVDLSNGQSITITISGTVGPLAADFASLNSEAQVQWTSLDDEVTSSVGEERTGVDGALNSGVLNDYQQQDILAIPVAQELRVSRVGGLDDTSAADPTSGPSEDVAVGEIIRYRVVGLIPEGLPTNYSLTIQVDEGLTILPETANQILIALISNGNGLFPIVDTGANQIDGNEQSPEAGDIPTDLSNGPSGVLNPNLYTISADGRTLTINLATIANNDDGDKPPEQDDAEGISLEFNVRVDNVAGNIAGTQLGMTVTESRNGTDFTSERIVENIAEPGFSGLDKSVVDFDPGVGSSTGNAVVDVGFSQNGTAPAYDVSLTDAFPEGSNYTVNSVTIDGVSYDLGSLPDGVSVDTTDGVTVTFAQLDPGQSVTVNYSVDVPNDSVVAEADAQATLTWSSLPEDFTEFAGSTVGADGSVEGERDGRDGAGGVNDYILTDGAGLGIIEGTLWDDTNNANGVQDADEAAFAGQTVTLTWAGNDGQFGSADDEQFTIETDANGQYQFGVLPTGLYRITAADEFTDADAGDVRARYDSDGGTFGDGSLADITITLGEGSESPANIGYVQLNDAPVNEGVDSATAEGDEDAVIDITGLSISDPDARDSDTLQVTLEVLSGTLSIDDAGGADLQGDGSATLVITGTVAQINTALSNLTYQGNLNFNGEDTLTITTNDQGSFGDNPDVDLGNGIPGQNPDDALEDVDTLVITVNAVNDAPTANDDTAIAVEAGGTNNNQVGVDPNGFVLNNDTDVDIATNDDVLSVIQAGMDADNLQAVDADPSQPLEIAGTYGTLIIGSDGFAQYIVDNDNPDVQALRQSGDTLSESFVYEIADLADATSQASISVTIQGANDTPVAEDDTATAIEAGGVNNGSGGQDASGNVLDNDSDVDEYGETQAVSAIRVGDKDADGAFTDVSAGTGSADGTSITGQYGTLTIGADGSYLYVVDNDNTDVQRLTDGDSLSEDFSYVVTDAGGLDDIATLTITIDGSQDNPVATDNSTTAQAPSTDGNTPAQNGTGNLITDDDGDGVDDDVDEVDQPNTNLAVNGIRTGEESAGGTLTEVTAGTDVTGSYGTLTVNPDGSYEYVVDGSNPDVQALAAGETITETFTYQLVDTDGNTDLAQLVVTITGANDPPVPVDDNATAIEAGGVDNGTPGVDPSGNVLDNDSDVDDPTADLSVSDFSQGGTSVAAGQTITGAYGSLTINADGSYSYVLDNDNPQVQALRTAGNTLGEVFTYTVVDPAGSATTATLTITIEGRNDTPVANDDDATAIEAGGIDNGTPGSDPSGNVLDNDSDVDGADNGETKSVVSVSQGSNSAQAGESLAGQYGTLVINADGSYTYVVDNDNPDVQALRTSGQTLTDNFDYVMRDTAGATSQAALTIVIQGANDTPVANDDSAIAVEAGGIDNGTPGTDPSGNVLDNDSDVDGADNGETKTVVSVSQGSNSAQAGESLAGQYGTLVINADGSYRYVVDNDNPDVQALRTPGQTLTENFDYVMRDTAGANASARLTIVIQGANDTPVANDDSAIAVEAGGTNNGSGGVDPSGNVLDNDTDVDAGDNKIVTGIRTGSEAEDGDLLGVAGNRTIAGEYGSLTIHADGSFTYVVDNSLAAVQALVPGETLQEAFTYRMRDTAGDTDIAQLTLTIRGAWDAPVASNDFAYAVADTPDNPTPGIDPSGNLLSNDSDVDGNDSLGVGGVRAGAESAGAVPDNMTDAGVTIVGDYGTLTVMPDGSYTYVVDDAALVGLDPLGFVVDRFTYSAQDLGGLTDPAQLTVFVRGRNEAPVAENDTGQAIEAGGLGNATPGSPANGNVLDNDSDPDADVAPGPSGPNLQVIGIRTGDIDGSGSAGAVGEYLQGQYGRLIINSDGSYTYEVNDDDPAVQALRQSGQTLVDVFTYTIGDRWAAESSAELSVTIDGRNDTPIASDDDATAVEAGGIDNGTPGIDPSGNVLDNDTDVDGTGYGETKHVVSVSQGNGTALAGQTLQGRYGTLIINADGSYRYEVDNDNPTVQALRTAGETLTERFDYVMRDTAGDTSNARLTIVIQGANDNPVARDDSNFASDQTPEPQATGNVLPNDNDVDGGDELHVVDVRPLDGGDTAAAGQALYGRYGTLLLNADGSYEYIIDMSNSEVLRAAGRGAILDDVFVYRITDKAGATATANLTITLDIAAPYIPVKDGIGPHFLDRDPWQPGPGSDLGFEPVVYVTPEVQRSNLEASNYLRLSHGANPRLVTLPEIQSLSLAEGLGQVEGQFVRDSVLISRAFAEQDSLLLLGRHGRTSLSADGLLPDPSFYAPTRSAMFEGTLSDDDAPQQAPSQQSAPSLAPQANDGRPALPPGARWVDGPPALSDGSEGHDGSVADNASTADSTLTANTTIANTTTASAMPDAATSVAPSFRQQLLAATQHVVPFSGESDS
ncbi:VCBS domain-containing protein [Halomonas binhaiensis]|uniref:VCBS domain-containing protein n=1 Tax=Halomonas binhaiensis TaxID=2562282 RepID=A0A5C1NBK0_9GAMM|nr:VCBS domain-containing protein [Halomonas binhaiensis]QEM80331.1 VCBS domain-containing protein [Halomonas binhaiensis]